MFKFAVVLFVLALFSALVGFDGADTTWGLPEFGFLVGLGLSLGAFLIERREHR